MYVFDLKRGDKNYTGIQPGPKHRPVSLGKWWVEQICPNIPRFLLYPFGRRMEYCGYSPRPRSLNLYHRRLTIPCYLSTSTSQRFSRMIASGGCSALWAPWSPGVACTETRPNVSASLISHSPRRFRGVEFLTKFLILGRPLVVSDLSCTVEIPSRLSRFVKESEAWIPLTTLGIPGTPIMRNPAVISPTPQRPTFAIQKYSSSE